MVRISPTQAILNRANIHSRALGRALLSLSKIILTKPATIGAVTSEHFVEIAKLGSLDRLQMPNCDLTESGLNV